MDEEQARTYKRLLEEAGQFHGPDLVLGFRFAVLAVGRAEQVGLAAEHAFEQPFGGRDFEAQLGERHVGNVGVGIGMVADVVAGGEDAAHQLGMLLRVVADNEKGGLHSGLLEDVQDLGRIARVRAVVEGQGQGLGREPVPLDDVGRGGNLEVFLGDEVGRRIEGDRAPADARPLGDGEDFTLAFVVQVVIEPDFLQLLGFRLAGRPVQTEKFPDGGILAAETPEGETGRVQGHEKVV